ncbi:MAG: hypothetical protein HY860_04190 [Chlamydiales bacterium]|nr:hypothetical protein [Chlamydiales bacterium]
MDVARITPPVSRLLVLQKALTITEKKQTEEKDKRNAIIALNLFSGLQPSNYKTAQNYAIQRDFFTGKIDQITSDNCEEKTVAIIIIALSILSLIGIYFVVNGMIKSAEYSKREQEFVAIQSNEIKLQKRHDYLEQRIQTLQVSTALPGSRHLDSAQPSIPVDDGRARELTPSSIGSDVPSIEILADELEEESTEPMFICLQQFIEQHGIAVIEKTGDSTMMWSIDALPKIIGWLKKQFLTKEERKPLAAATMLMQEEGQACSIIIGLKVREESAHADLPSKHFLYLVIPNKKEAAFQYRMEIYDITELSEGKELSLMGTPIEEQRDIMSMLEGIYKKEGWSSNPHDKTVRKIFSMNQK